MAITILLNIKAQAAMLVECADGSFQLVAQVEDSTPYVGNPLVAYIEGDDWSKVDANWKTEKGESRAEYFGHSLDKVTSTVEEAK